MGEHLPLKFWLESILLAEYYDHFVQGGLTSQELLVNLDNDQLIDIGVSLQGHRRRILNHLPTAESGHWIDQKFPSVDTMEEDDMPSLPPKTKSVRMSYLYNKESDPGGSIYMNLDGLDPKTDNSSATPKPKPRPRTKSASKGSQSSEDTNQKPKPAKRPTPAPRRSVPRDSGKVSPDIKTVKETNVFSDTSEVPADNGESHSNPRSLSFKLKDVCIDESSTDISESPLPCYQTGESSQAQYNLFGATPNTNSMIEAQNEANSDKQDEINTQASCEFDAFAEFDKLAVKSATSDDPFMSELNKSKSPAKKQESFENATFDSFRNQYVLKSEELIDFDPLLDSNKKVNPTSAEHRTSDTVGASCAISELDLNEGPDNESAYEPIWITKKRNSSKNAQTNSSSNLMEFSPLSSDKQEEIAGVRDNSVPMRPGQTLHDTKYRESFNLPHPAFAPPPLPPTGPPEENDDDEDLAKFSNMPPVPPRPASYEKTKQFKPYVNVPFVLSGESPTMPGDSNMEPDSVISPQPIASYRDGGISVSTDPFHGNDPFGDFTPDSYDFSHSGDHKPQTKTKLNDSSFFYEVAQEVPSPKPVGPTSPSNGGAIYEYAEEPQDFDPFGLRSNYPLPRTMSTASSTSSGSHNLNVVPPAPNWAQRTPLSGQSMFGPGNLEDGDSSSNGSLEDILDGETRQGDADDSINTMSPVEILPTTALSPRRRERSGYLYKQGGVKQNKGWQKRWVIFDGKSLRYYKNSKDQVSKRIVPLSCMSNVEMDVKRNSRRSSKRSSDSSFSPNNSRQFKFKLGCSNRVFLFATDSLDDCKMWSSTLMEAIITYKSPAGGEVAGGDMASPDIEGWMKINKNRLKFYVALKKHKLCYYQSLDDYKMASPLHEIDMKLSAVKEVERTKLQLSTHYSQFMLHFESSSDASNWKMALEEAITDALGDNTILDQVKENPDNIRCADCGAMESHWASMNLGIVLCVKCAGIHRSFDNRLSKIRSLRMDTKVWNSSLIEVFKEIGNKNANKFWQHKLPPGQEIDEGTSSRERKEFIMKKYKDKSFCDIHDFSSETLALNEALLECAQTTDVLQTMQILLSGADVLYTRPNQPNLTAYELAKQAHQRIQMEFLLQNGGDKTQNFMPGSEEASLVAKLRAEVQFQGFLNKTGSNMKDFLRRWVVLEHGHISYYENEESKVEKDRIDSDAILCMQASSTDKHPFCFELSTKKSNNRVYLFSANSETEREEWMRYIAQIFCPVNLMDQMKSKAFTFAGFAHMKTGFSRDWQRTWYMLEKRKLCFTDKEQQEREEDSLDLRKVTNITRITSGMEACDTCLEHGLQIVLNAPDRALYLQADLTKDTERIFKALEVAIKKGGDVLEDQPLDSMDVPVIISQCVNFIQIHGVRMKGIYREAAQNSRIQSLLDRFREDARSVVLKMEDNTVHEVCNVLKRFLRNLSDPLLTEQLYRRWIHTASESDSNTKRTWYKYLLLQMPQVNYLTLRCLVDHLNKLLDYRDENLMTLDNISIAFGSTLMKSAAMETAVSPAHMGQAVAFEMKVITDIVSDYRYLFDTPEDDPRQPTSVKPKVDEQSIIEYINACHSQTVSDIDNMMIYVKFLDSTGSEESVRITKKTTASDVIKNLVGKLKLPTNVWCLHEVVKNELERPLHPQTNVWGVVTEWQNWSKDYASTTHLVMKNNLLREKIEKAFDPRKPLFAEMKYTAKKKYVKMAFEFTQAKLACYKDSRSLNHAQSSWNIEDISIYKGCDSRRPNPPTKWAFSFVCKGDRCGESDKVLPYFGRTVCCNSEQELMNWLGGMMMAQDQTVEKQEVVPIILTLSLPSTSVVVLANSIDLDEKSS